MDERTEIIRAMIAANEAFDRAIRALMLMAAVPSEERTEEDKRILRRPDLFMKAE